MYVIPMAFLVALSPTNITLVILMLMSKNSPVARARAVELGFMTDRSAAQLCPATVARQGPCSEDRETE
jgi:hypothetical protein